MVRATRSINFMIKDKEIVHCKPTATVEDYLAAIYILERDKEAVIGARLAELLQVSAPTVTLTLKRMSHSGWIISDEKKEIHLTDQGCELASSVIRRHMLTEWMLTRMLHMSWSQVHAEADKIEHTLSLDVEERLRSQMNNPQTCPHGNPLPGFEGIAADWLPLTEIPLGTHVIIRRIHEHAEENPDLMSFLETHNILPGVQVIVSEKLDFNHTITLNCTGEMLVIGFSIAEHIFVELIETEE